MSLNRYRAIVRVATESEYLRERYAAFYTQLPLPEIFTVIPQIGNHLEFGNSETVDSLLDMLNVDKTKHHNYTFEVVAVVIMCRNDGGEPLHDFSVFCVYKPSNT